jgi:hypothetical protein
LATLVHSTKTFFCLESSHVKRPNWITEENATALSDRPLVPNK